MPPTDPELIRDIELVDEIARRATGQVPTPEPAPEVPSTSAAARQGLEAARPFIQMGTVLPRRTRLRTLKRLLLALSRPVSRHQVQFNQGIHQAVESLVESHERSVASLRAALATAEVTLAEHAEEAERLRIELAVLRGALDQLGRLARAALPESDSEQFLSALSRQLDGSYADLYRDLEAVFRGSHDDIKQALATYLDDVTEACRTAPLLDIGSGRGEWLELLGERGVEAYGVDINETFIEDGRARGLDVRQGDALVHLRELPEGSLGAVTAFHVVEHLSLDDLVELIDLSLRALRPGGVVIFETPNPTNVTVGAASFYLDPTHLKPLHPQFLEFLMGQRGFTRVEVRYLHEPAQRPLPAWPSAPGTTPPSDDDTARSFDHLNWALFGPLDYAVIATKAGEPAR